MKKVILFSILSSLFIIPSTGQEKSPDWVGIHGSVSTVGLFRLSPELDGAPVHNGRLGLLVGVEYVMKINDKFDIEIGIDISKNRFKASYPNNKGQLIDQTDPEFANLLSIPVNIRYRILKDYFVAGGVQYDLKMNTADGNSISNQTGFGLNLKGGREFQIKDRLKVAGALKFSIHSLIPLHNEKSPKRMTALGILVSIRYGLPKKTIKQEVLPSKEEKE